MKKMDHLKNQLVTALEVPADLAYGEPVVTVTGKHRAVVENYRSILRYTKEEILLLTMHGRLSIQGRGLKIPCYHGEEMEITGCIFGVFLEPPEESPWKKS